MEPSKRVPRKVKTEGADLIVGQGYITATDFPKLLNDDWREEFHAQINDELRLRTVTQRAYCQIFDVAGAESAPILYDPERFTDEQASTLVRRQLDA